MKNLLFLLAFIPTLAFSQVSSWRTNPPQQRVETPKEMMLVVGETNHQKSLIDLQEQDQVQI